MQKIFFNGPAGLIQGVWHKSSHPNAPIALVLHPNPIYGGDMNNKVTYNMYKTLVKNNVSTLRINFRGVGDSEGDFDNGKGSLADAATALDWMQNRCSNSRYCFVTGFSFGAWVATQIIIRRPEIDDFIMVAPPIKQYDFSCLIPSPPTKGLFLQGSMDSVVLAGDVTDMVSKFNKIKKTEIQYKIIEGGDHFFRDQIASLNKAMDLYIKSSLNVNVENKSNNKVFLS